MTPAQAEVEFRCQVHRPELSLVRFTVIRDSGGQLLTIRQWIAQEKAA